MYACRTHCQRIGNETNTVDRHTVARRHTFKHLYMGMCGFQLGQRSQKTHSALELVRVFVHIRGLETRQARRTSTDIDQHHVSENHLVEQNTTKNTTCELERFSWNSFYNRQSKTSSTNGNSDENECNITPARPAAHQDSQLRPG